MLIHYTFMIDGLQNVGIYYFSNQCASRLTSDLGFGQVFNDCSNIAIIANITSDNCLERILIKPSFVTFRSTHCDDDASSTEFSS